MLHRPRIGCALIFVLFVLPPAPTLAQDVDPHALYESSCARCHEEHAREFTADRLSLRDDGMLYSQSGIPLRPFLAGGHGGLDSDEVDVMLDHLAAIIRGHGLFEQKCRICHDRAHDFARLKLIVRDDRLVGRYTDRDVAAFLSYHGRLTPSEVPFMVETLRRQIQPGSGTGD